jgi:hypothetical protein
VVQPPTASALISASVIDALTAPDPLDLRPAVAPSNHALHAWQSRRPVNVRAGVDRNLVWQLSQMNAMPGVWHARWSLVIGSESVGCRRRRTGARPDDSLQADADTVN